MAASDEGARRSGRSTKGQHKQLDAEATPKSTPKTKKGAANANSTANASTSKKNGKKTVEADPEPEPEPEVEGEEEDEEEDDDEAEGDDEVRCVCGATTENNKDDKARGTDKYVSCDACSVWQHNICMGLPLEEAQLPDHYLCEQCNPDDHQPLLEAMERGEKPWLERQEDFRKNKKKGRRSVGARVSKTPGELKNEQPSSAAASPAPASSTRSGGEKRKTPHDEATPQAPPSAADLKPKNNSAATPGPADPSAGSDDAAATPPAPPAPVSASPVSAAVASTTKSATPTDNSKRRKSGAPAAKETKLDVETALVDISQLPRERQNVANAIKKILVETIDKRAKADSFQMPKDQTSVSVATHHASRIEYALYMNHSGSGGKIAPAYGHQFRAINANFKTNPVLIDRVLNKSLSADELSTMASEDMASEEKQKEIAAMKEEVEKQSVMIQDDGSEKRKRIKRTHKGDEIVEDEADDNNNNAEQSIYTSQPVRHRHSDHEQDAVKSPQNAAATTPPERMDVDEQKRRASAQNFDISGVWAKTHQSPDSEHAPARLLQQAPRRRSSVSKQQETGQKVDADVDRMLEDNDDEPYSPKGDSDPTWHGVLSQPGAEKVGVNARHVAGCDFGRFISWQDLLPKGYTERAGSVLEIEGRIDVQKADDYLCGLQWSKTSDVTVLALTPRGGSSSTMAFDNILDYFSARKRYAVISRSRMSNIVKDVYCTPVDAGGKYPPHIDLLEFSELPNPPDTRVLLMTIVINKPKSWHMSAPTDGPGYENEDEPPTQVVFSQYGPGPTPDSLPDGAANGQNGHAVSAVVPPAHFMATAAHFAGGTPQLPAPQSSSIHPTPSHPGFGTVAAAPPNPNSADPALLAQIPLILGPFANSKSVVEIVQYAGAGLRMDMLLNMRRILDNDPACADDMMRFSAHLFAS